MRAAIRALCSVFVVVALLASTTRPLYAEQGAKAKEIFDLNANIQQKQKHLEEIQTRISAYTKSIRTEQGNELTLKQRLRVLDERVAKQKLEIERVQVEQEEVTLQIQEKKLALEQAQQSIDTRLVLLGALLTTMRASDTQPQLQAVLASDSVGAYFAHLNQLMQVQEQLRTVLSDVRKQRVDLEQTARELAAKQNDLTSLGEQLLQQQQTLVEEQQTKERLLATTQQNEQRYQSQVAALKAEVQATDNEIVALEAQVRKHLEEIDASFGTTGHVAFSWPVSNRGITTYFHDPDYPFRYLFEHPAIDIRAAQGNIIRAPAPGYIAKNADNGYGYSYVMIIHPGGFSTVYGHVSCFQAKEGSYVDRGDPVACVGGRPGTRGAGPYTTGSHLHFEIRLNGIPVNPLNYLL